MIILTIRTDKPEAEIGLFDDHKKLVYETWQAHRELSATIHKKTEAIMGSQGLSLPDIEGIVGFKGPGSFTGLRIGLTVVNALAYSLSFPVVGQAGQEWIRQGTERLIAGENELVALPEYGGPAFTTQPRK